MKKIIEMAREAGIRDCTCDGTRGCLERFAALVRADEREKVIAEFTEAEQEPVAWADLQKKAQQIVESKFLWKRFIDGTPLANDIACWMADFARQYTAPPLPVQPEQEPVAWEQFHEHLVEHNFCPRCGKRTADLTTIHTCTPPRGNT